MKNHQVATYHFSPFPYINSPTASRSVPSPGFGAWNPGGASAQVNLGDHLPCFTFTTTIAWRSSQAAKVAKLGTPTNQGLWGLSI